MWRGSSMKRSDEDAPVAEGRHRLIDGRRHALAEVGFIPNEAHALAAASGRRLEHDRVADLAGRSDRRIGVVDRVLRAGNGGDAGLGGNPARGELISHRRDGVRRRADERDSRLPQRLSERRTFGEEAVAGMHSLGAGLRNRVQEGVHVQIALGSSGGADEDGLVRHARVQCALVGF